MPDIQGKCLCGAVTITVTDPVGWVGACHCRICQRWSGGLWAGFPVAQDKMKVEGEVSEYASSPIANRGFCAACGTQLWMRDVSEGADYDMMPGLFDEAVDWPLKSEVYCDQAMAAFALQGAHPKATAATYREKNPKVGEV